MSTTSEGKWDWNISAKTSFWSWGIDEIWSYRHLLFSLVRRDFLLNYQQTILGPLWILFQPLLTLVTYVLVFGKLVRLDIGNVPPTLFYFSGIVLWNFFSDSFGGTSNTFRDNAHIFSKVYFPRFIMPVSVISTHFLRFVVQLLLFIFLIAYYVLFRGFAVSYNWWLLAFPFSIIFIGIIGLGLGLLFSVLTAKYRDIGNLVGVAIRLLMFVTPVIYPLATVPERVRWIVQINPLTPLFELFRLSLLGEGIVSVSQLLYSVLFMVVVFFGAILVFNKQGDKLIDVV